ncbi:MAG: DNA helicase II [Desulfobulbus propionicus]|nr:MAG: DNA helicase II [Desulfobulbus propionicus]
MQGLACWAAIKGIKVVGTGDFTHPVWFSQIVEQLEEAEPGLYRLKKACLGIPENFPDELRGVARPEQTRFMLTSEISSIYKKKERVRKNHNLLFAPCIDDVRRLNTALADIGNLHSDGRPILGLDARDLLEMMLEHAPEGYLVPAHVWTPWFSLFGSRSGFDRLEDCFEDLSSHIFALETGLSSDPDMNRCISALDRFTLISNSDCHSPGKLGREANLFSTECDFYHLREAIRRPVDSSGRQVFTATVEFYPEEGKYHCDGHRKCGVCFEPVQTRAHKGTCPSCGRPLTVGVLHRVMELADREQPHYPAWHPEVFSCIPLVEVLSELLKVGPNSKKVAAAYARVVSSVGPEFSVLLDAPVEDISRRVTPLLGEAIRRIREKKVIRKPGFDGEYGVIRVFEKGEMARYSGQIELFSHILKKSRARPERQILGQQGKKKRQQQASLKQLNREQQQVTASSSKVVVVKAGPGTGKTHTLVERVLLTAASCPCTVITFTNKAADEVRDRIQRAGPKAQVRVFTFHGYCLYWLRRQKRFQVIGEEDRDGIVRELFPDMGREDRQLFSRELSCTLATQPNLPLSTEQELYLAHTDSIGSMDLDAVLPAAVRLLQQNGSVSQQMRTETGALFVDEFQDINMAQYNLVAELAKTSSVFVIGDPDQAIYGFRGADVRLFNRFARTFQAEKFQLVRNYRSGARILEAAGQVIGHNTGRDDMVTMRSMGANEGVVYVSSYKDPYDEARKILEHIEKLLGGTSHREIERFDKREQQGENSLKDIGILFRTSSMARPVSSVLSRQGIPFQLVDLKAFYNQNEMKVIYYTLLCLAGKSTLAQELYVYSREKDVGEKTIDRLRIFFKKESIQTVRQLRQTPLSSVEKHKDVQRLLLFFSALFKQVQAEDDLLGVIDRVAERNALQHIPELQQFKLLACNYGASLMEFTEYLHRHSDSAVYAPHAEAVTLSTLHAAKGLEFKVVFIIGAEDTIVPLAPRNTLNPKLRSAYLEEERRLFYVGMTRAIDSLFISWCRNRNCHGVEKKQVKSRYIDEISDTCISSPLRSSRRKGNRRGHKQLCLFSEK